MMEDRTQHEPALPAVGETLATEGTKTAEEPQPTYVPAALAMGIMMLLWGILTNWIMSVAGAALMVWAIAAWIGEMHET